jgi:type IV pilus assembly protein PilW
MKRQKGFSLLELLCAVVIGLICLTVVVEVFFNFRQTYLIGNAFAEVQENARFAADVLKADIELAGFVGCRKFSSVLSVANDGVLAADNIEFDNTFFVYVAALPSFIKYHSKAGTDVILVRHMSAAVAQLKSDSNMDELIVNNTSPRFKKNEDIIIADCKQVLLTQLKAAYKYTNYQRLITAKPLSRQFYAGVDVGKIVTSAFLILPTGRKNAYGDEIDALYQIDGKGKRSELVEGVINMKVVCFELNEAGFLAAKQPDKVISWHNVRSIQIDLLLRSHKQILSSPKPYYFNGQQYQTTDKYLYKEFKLYISLQERN